MLFPHFTISFHIVQSAGNSIQYIIKRYLRRYAKKNKIKIERKHEILPTSQQNLFFRLAPTMQLLET